MESIPTPQYQQLPDSFYRVPDPCLLIDSQEMSPQPTSLERSTSAGADSKSSFSTVEKVISNSRSCGWLIIRIIQIATCVFVLGLAIFLLTCSTSDNDLWSTYHPISRNLTGTSIPVQAPIYIMLGVTSLSLLSSLISLITYCCHRLSIKFVVFWDFLMSMGWIMGSVFMGVLLADEGGWASDYWVMDIYKLMVVLGGIATLLFITSGGLGIRLHQKSKKRASSVYGPMRTPVPSYSSRHSHPGTVGTPYRTYSNYTIPPPNYRPSGEWESVVLDVKIDGR